MAYHTFKVLWLLVIWIAFQWIFFLYAYPFLTVPNRCCKFPTHICWHLLLGACWCSQAPVTHTKGFLWPEKHVQLAYRPGQRRQKWGWGDWLTFHVSYTKFQRFSIIWAPTSYSSNLVFKTYCIGLIPFAILFLHSSTCVSRVAIINRLLHIILISGSASRKTQTKRHHRVSDSFPRRFYKESNWMKRHTTTTAFFFSRECVIYNPSGFPCFLLCWKLWKFQLAQLTSSFRYLITFSPPPYFPLSKISHYTRKLSLLLSISLYFYTCNI